MSERDQAVERLNEAVSLRSRLHREREGANDTPGGEMAVDAALRVADNHVAARERWLQSLEDREY
jgi:hypothetical protein